MRRVALVLALVVLVLAGATLASAALDRPSATVREELVVPATAEAVWRVLTDFDAYGEWNPYVTRAQGEVRLGATVRLRLEPRPDETETVECELLTVKVARKLRWRCRKYAPGILDEEHTFRILRLGPDRVRLVYDGRFEGLLQPFADLDEKLSGYPRMARALGARALSSQE